MANPVLPAKAFSRFDKTLARGEALVALYERLIKVKLTKPPHQFVHTDLDDLLRSGLVLGVAAMDSYFTGRFAELLVAFLKKHGATDKLVELLSEAGLDTREALAMINMSRPYRRVRTLMDSHFERYTTQRAGVVDELFLAYGIKDFSNNAQRLVKRGKLVRRIDLMVQRRHGIVHEGDLNSHGKTCIIDGPTVSKQMKDLRLFVQASNELTIRRMK